LGEKPKPRKCLVSCPLEKAPQHAIKSFFLLPFVGGEGEKIDIQKEELYIFLAWEKKEGDKENTS